MNRECTLEKISKLAKKDCKGYILEVDFEYPKELYKTHNELPFLTERMNIGKVEKLVPNLNKKKKIRRSHQGVGTSTNHGLVLKRMHRAIKSEQSAWLEPYIMQQHQRTSLKNEKDFFKLMNNSVFGKTMENIRNHRDMELVTN